MAGSFSRVAAIKAAAIMTLSTYITIALGLVVSAVLARSLVDCWLADLLWKPWHSYYRNPLHF
jgi:hypothetical protein